MSRQNKVNPGMYTQRGRLTQDDAARELKRQRSIGSQYTWQPVQKDQRPRPVVAKDDPNRGAEVTSEDNEALEAAPVETKPKASKAKAAKTTVAKSKTGKVKTANAETSNAKRARPAKSAKTTKTKTVARRAVLARNVGGGGPKPRPAAKRRKS